MVPELDITITGTLAKMLCPMCLVDLQFKSQSNSLYDVYGL